MTIENLYFPLFLLVAGLLVVWLFNRLRDSGGSVSKRRSSNSGKNLQQNAKLQRSITPKGPAVGRSPNHGLKTQDAMWRSRRQRAKHHGVEDNPDANNSPVFTAGYLDPSEVWGQPEGQKGSIDEQSVRDTEYTGLDEYLAKKAAEAKLKKEQEEKELSMTAMKYEPVESNSEEEEELKSQGGFKP